MKLCEMFAVIGRRLPSGFSALEELGLTEELLVAELEGTARCRASRLAAGTGDNDGSRSLNAFQGTRIGLQFAFQGGVYRVGLVVAIGKSPLEITAVHSARIRFDCGFGGSRFLCRVGIHFASRIEIAVIVAAFFAFYRGGDRRFGVAYYIGVEVCLRIDAHRAGVYAASFVCKGTCAVGNEGEFAFHVVVVGFDESAVFIAESRVGGGTVGGSCIKVGTLHRSEHRVFAVAEIISFHEYG